MTDYLTDEAIAAIEANRQPAVLHVPRLRAPHTPLQATHADYDALGPHRRPPRCASTPR